MKFLDYNGLQYFWGKLKVLFQGKQDTLVSGTNIKTVNGESILGSGNITAGDPNAVKYVAQTLTDAQKTQARTNIGAVAASAISALETAIAAKYSKPSGGIPETDLASGVQSALALARTSIQSLANYYSKTEIDALLAAVGSEQYVDVTTLPTASASTLGKIYLVGPDANGFYDRYYTSYDGSTYSWVAVGNTEINLANYATKEEVSQLQQEVTADISQLEARVDDLEAGNYTSAQGTVTITIPLDNVVASLYAPANDTKFGSSGYFSAYYVPIDKAITVTYMSHITMSNWHIVVTDAIPAQNGSYTQVAKGVVNEIGTFNVNAGQYIVILMPTGRTTGFPDLSYTKYSTMNILDLSKSLRNHRIKDLAPTYFNGVRLVDTFTKQRYGRSTNTKIGNFTPVSATEDTITLSAEDAACIVNTVILSCKLNNGDYKDVYFSAASGNVITKLYDFGESIDCQDIVLMESLHDTVNGGQGIHLSPFGYRAMAHILYNELQTKHPFSDVFVGGWSAQFCKGSTGYSDPRVRDANEDVVCTPTLDGITAGGATNRCEMVYAANIPDAGPYYRTYYNIVQLAPDGAKATFRINSLYPFKGFLRVNCCRYPEYNGTVNLVIKDFDGETIGTKGIAPFADSFIFWLDTKYYDGVDVIVQMPDNETSGIKITEMTLHETYVELPQIRPIDSKSVVAMLGSSNTQFPSLSTAEELCPGDTDNSIVERPDGTLGDGCGYFGKELARVSGAVVDNWGKSGEQTPYGLDVIQKVFETKRYTHIVLSLFANDNNANRPWAEIISNIRMMAEYAKGHGCIPIVVMGYAINGTGVGIGYALMYEDLTQGMDSPFIYTSAEYHRA